MERMGANTELIRVIVKIFRDDSPAQLLQIGKAIQSEDKKSLLAVAHTLKGSLLALAANEGAKTAEKLEGMGRTGDLTGAHDLLLQLEAEIANVSAALQDLVNSLA
jgi:HPt (histidine-containing phosphotransfer) domain-containing protein